MPRGKTAKTAITTTIKNDEEIDAIDINLPANDDVVEKIPIAMPIATGRGLGRKAKNAIKSYDETNSNKSSSPPPPPPKSTSRGKKVTATEEKPDTNGNKKETKKRGAAAGGRGAATATGKKSKITAVESEQQNDLLSEEVTDENGVVEPKINEPPINNGTADVKEVIVANGNTNSIDTLNDEQLLLVNGGNGKKKKIVKATSPKSKKPVEKQPSSDSTKVMDDKLDEKEEEQPPVSAAAVIKDKKRKQNDKKIIEKNDADDNIKADIKEKDKAVVAVVQEVHEEIQQPIAKKPKKDTVDKKKKNKEEEAAAAAKEEMNATFAIEKIDHNADEIKENVEKVIEKKSKKDTVEKKKKKEIKENGKQIAEEEKQSEDQTKEVVNEKTSSSNKEEKIVKDLDLEPKEKKKRKVDVKKTVKEMLKDPIVNGVDKLEVATVEVKTIEEVVTPPTAAEVTTVTVDDKKKVTVKKNTQKLIKEKKTSPPVVHSDIENDDDDDDGGDTKTSGKQQKASKQKIKPLPKLNQIETDFSSINFNIDKESNLKIVSWNVAGLRALTAKGGMEYFNYEKPDIICLQEIKCTDEEIPEEAKIPGYHPYTHSKAGGRSGVIIYSKIMPYNVEYGLGDDEQDDECRLITAEYEHFFLICVYVPNSGRKLVTLPKRLKWNKLFEDHITKLNDKKSVIICGDMNVSHLEIDLANPKSNKRNAGFTQEERDGMTNMLSLGFIDTFRELYPERKDAYTYWTYMAKARQNNIGWRLDYFIASEKLKTKIVDNIMRTTVLGSDHCPIVLFLNL